MNYIPKKYKKEVFRNLSLITQLGLHVMVPIFLCVLVGVWIDKEFGLSTTVVLLILGILAGGRNAYILAMRVVNQNELDDKKGKHGGNNDKE